MIDGVRTPEGILAEMRRIGAGAYMASWEDDDGDVIAACVVVDGHTAAMELARCFAHIDPEPAPPTTVVSPTNETFIR